jgi:hypothetical protein
MQFNVEEYRIDFFKEEGFTRNEIHKASEAMKAAIDATAYQVWRH